jgi:deoxycytidylate deaminase
VVRAVFRSDAEGDLWWRVVCGALDRWKSARRARRSAAIKYAKMDAWVVPHVAARRMHTLYSVNGRPCVLCGEHIVRFGILLQFLRRITT